MFAVLAIIYRKLQNVNKISKAFIEKKISEWSEDGVLRVLADVENIDEEEKKIIGKMIFAFIGSAKDSIKEKII